MKSTVKEGKRTRATARKARRASRKTERQAPRIYVTFRHLDSTDALRDYAERKFRRLSRFLSRDAQMHLTLWIDKYRHCGEVTVKSGHLTLTAEDETQDLYAVIDGLHDKISRQLHHFHGKNETRRVRGNSTGETTAIAQERTAP